MNTPINTPMNTALHTLLDAGLRLAPEYTDAHTAHRDPEPAYASHLPMALHALSALGADDVTLRAFDERERAQMPPRAPWPGLDADEAALRRRIATEGAASVLGERLPARMAHAGAVAFHGLIRTAHAWESGHAGELALALAWWGQRDQALPAPKPALPAPPVPDLALPAWLDALRALPQPDGLPRAWIAARMQAWSASAGFQAVAPRLRLQASTLRDLADWALGAYARSGNFTLLHAVTATRALAVLGPQLPPEATTGALRAFSLHLAAAVLASGWRGDGSAPEPLGWPELRARALAHTDDHAIKLTHAAWDWAQRGHDDALCRQAATRALGAAR